MDYHFVPNLSFGLEVVRACRQHTALPFQVHLMVENPHFYFEPCQEIGVDTIFIHAECHPDILIINLRALQKMGIKPGLVMNPQTPLSYITNLFPYVESILIMTVQPGFSGQTFLTEVLCKVEEALKVCPSSFKIMVDGGINAQTLPLCYSLGVRDFVVGSALFQGGHTEDRAEILHQRWEYLVDSLPTPLHQDHP